MTWLPPRRVLIAAALLLAALALRVAYVQSTSYRPINDARLYLRLASEIAHSGSYSSRDRGAGGTRGPTAYFPPGYPYFLGAVDIVDGHRGSGANSWRGALAPGAVHGARLSQAVLGTVTVALVGLVALEVFGSTVALIALGLAAIYPVLIELSGTLVPENLLTPLVLAAVWAALRVRTAQRPYWWIAAAGVLTGLATLAHENGALILIPLAAAVWTVRPRFSRRALAAPLLLIAVVALTVAPWTVRNAIMMHHFIPVSDETGITLVGTYNPASASYREVPYKWRLYYGIPSERRLVRQSPRLTEPQLDARLRSEAFRYIGRHPFSPFVVAYHNGLRLLELEGSFAWHASAYAMGIPTTDAGVGVVTFWVLCALAIAGALTRLARAAPRWLWAVPALLALSVVLVNVETPRFRVPVDTFLILLAGSAIASAPTLLRRARRGLRAPVGGETGAAVPAGAGELIEMGKRLP